MSDDSHDTVFVPVEKVLAETERAILIKTEEGEAWIPLSQIDDESEVWKKGDTGTLAIKRWLAEKNDLFYEE